MKLSFQQRQAIAMMRISVGALLMPSAVSQAQSGAWNVDASGNWSNAGNWNPAAVPGNAAGDVVNFTNNISSTSARTITIDTTSRTVGTINIGDTDNTTRFIIAASGGASLIFDNGGSGASINEIGFVSGGTGTPNGSQEDITSAIRLDDNLTTNVAGQLSLTGVISESGGARSITKSGNGTLVLNGKNTYSGGFNFNSGTVMVAFTSITAGVSQAFGTGKLSISGGSVSTNSPTLNALADFQLNNLVDLSGFINLSRGSTGTKTWTQGSSGTVTLTGNTTLSSTNTAFVWTVNSSIGESGGARSLTVGSANFSLTANLNQANTHSGGTIVGSVNTILNINHASALGSGALTFSAAGTIDNTSGAALTLSTNNAQNWNSNFTFTGTKDLNLGSGNVTMGATRTITVSGGNLTIGGSIQTTSAGLIKAGAGTLSLGGTNLYTGLTRVNAGVLKLDSASALGSGNLTLAGGVVGLAAGNFSRTYGTGSGAFQMHTTSGGGFAAYGADRTVSLSASTINWGAANMSLQGLLKLSAADATHTVTMTNNITNGSAQTVEVADGSAAIDGAFSGVFSGVGSLTKTGAGTFAMLGSNTFTGNLIINGAGGTLQLGDGGTSGDLKAATSISVTAGTLSVQRSNAFTQATDLNGVAISGAGNFRQTGTGTTTLSVSNTYTGSTTVSSGSLIISGSGDINTTSGISVAAGAKFIYNSSTALTVAPSLAGAGTSNRAVLGGAGVINAAVTLDQMGDTLSPGNSPGILQFETSQSSWSSFSYDWELNDWTAGVAGADHDQVGILGSLNLTASSANSYQLNLLSLNGSIAGNVSNFAETSQSWKVLTTSGGITGFDAAFWQIDTTGFSNLYTGTWSLSQSGNDLMLSYDPIPEPHVSLLATAFGALSLLRRRR